ncbi:MAG: fibronectin type III domain-containing protein, partial [Thermoplasmata archaeon]|nr:fibronectin type III domain-containing protein [Thermoplasmata archaeon]
MVRGVVCSCHYAVSFLLLLSLLTVSFHLFSDLSASPPIPSPFTTSFNTTGMPPRNLTDLHPWPLPYCDERGTLRSRYNVSYNIPPVLWSVNVSGAGCYHKPLIGPNDMIVVISSPYLYAISSNGTILWRKNMPSWHPLSCSIGGNGTIFMVAVTTNVDPPKSGLFVFNLKGELLWNYILTGSPSGNNTYPYSPPVVGTDGNLYDGPYAFYPNGTIKWKIAYNQTTQNLYYTSEYNRIHPHGWIYICGGGYLYCVDPANGTILFRRGEVGWGPLIDDDGVLILISSSSGLFSLYPNGSLRWSLNLGLVFSPLGLLTNGDIIAIATESRLSTKHYLYVFSPTTGRVKDRFYLGNVTIEKAYLQAISSNNVIFYTTSTGNVTAILPNGTIKWKRSLLFRNRESYISINSNGSLIIAQKNTIYSFGATPPTPPQNISSHEGNSFINLSWDPPSDDGGYSIISYRVYRSTENSSFSLLSTLPASTTFFNDTSLINGQNYTYYVTAINRIGESPPSVKLTTSPFRYPDPPSNLTATPGNSFIYLSWKPPPFNGGRPIISYNIYRGTSPSDLSLLQSLPFSHLSYNDTQVKNGISYFY